MVVNYIPTNKLSFEHPNPLILHSETQKTNPQILKVEHQLQQNHNYSL